ncbi:MAG: choice-of-anchor B family protein [Vicingaceae bacterium]
MKILLAFLLLGSCLQGQNAWQLDSLFNWQDTSILESNLGDSSRYNEVWGFVQNGREYAVIGSTIGSHFFDVSDPLNVQMIDFVPGRYAGKFAVHRDYHDYKGYLYMVCDEGQSSLQIADLKHLPDSVHVVYDSDSLIIKAHNIFIDTAKGKLYGAAVKTHFQSPFNYVDIMAISLADPENPSLIYNFVPPSYVHDLFVRNDTVYANSSNGGLYVFDFSTPPVIKYLGSLNNYPDQGYNHSGWLNEKGTIYAFADETHGMSIKICDVSDLQNISVLSLVNSNVDSNSIPHNIMIKDNLMYVSYYHDGLYIYDINDPSQPVELAHFDTYLPTDHDGYKGAWGVYCFLSEGKILVSDIQTGLYVFDLIEPWTSVNDGVAVKQELKLFPNPTKGTLTLEMPGQLTKENGKIEIFNTIGELVHRQSIRSGENNIVLPEYLNNGIFVLQLNTETGTYKTRFSLVK